MPAVRAIYVAHPVTGIVGFYFELTGSPPGTITGIDRATIAALYPAGNAVGAAAQFRTAAKAAIQQAIDAKSPLGPGTVAVSLVAGGPVNAGLTPDNFQVVVSNG